MNWATILEWITIRWRGAATAKHLQRKGVASWIPLLGKCKREHWYLAVIVENFQVLFSVSGTFKWKKEKLSKTCQISLQLSPSSWNNYTSYQYKTCTIVLFHFLVTSVRDKNAISRWLSFFKNQTALQVMNQNILLAHLANWASQS